MRGKYKVTYGVGNGKNAEKLLLYLGEKYKEMKEKERKDKEKNIQQKEEKTKEPKVLFERQACYSIGNILEGIYKDINKSQHRIHPTRLRKDIEILFREGILIRKWATKNGTKRTLVFYGILPEVGDEYIKFCSSNI